MQEIHLYIILSTVRCTPRNVHPFWTQAVGVTSFCTHPICIQSLLSSTLCLSVEMFVFPSVPHFAFAAPRAALYGVSGVRIFTCHHHAADSHSHSLLAQCGGNQCCGSNKLNDDEFEKEEARLHAEGARLERERATSLERSSNEGKDTSAATDTQPTARDTMRAQVRKALSDEDP